MGITPAQTSFWLLKLVPPLPWGRWIAGGIIFALIMAPYLILGDSTEDDGVDLDVALFFATLFAYMIPVHHLIMERSLSALAQLQPQLSAHTELISQSQRKILCKSPLWQIAYLAVGIVAGIVHNMLIVGAGGLEDVLSRPGTLLNLSITTAIWVAMTTTVASLVENAVAFKRLAERVEFNVLNTRSLTPFGAVAASSTLALIGAQAAFPLLIVGSETSWVSFVPGLVATGAPMVVIFLLPVIPMHRRIMKAKQAALAQVALDLAPLTRSEQPDYAALEPLLTYRQAVIEAPEWPFDTTLIGRLAIYLIIPPLTWIGAALIEILIDTAI